MGHSDTDLTKVENIGEMKYTGYKDYRGNEIFIGDKVLVKGFLTDRVGVVGWYHDRAALYFSGGKEGIRNIMWSLTNRIIENYEVTIVNNI
mgnify:CR=1 FL=1